MKEFISSQKNIRRIEFWAATLLFVFFLFFYISQAVAIDNPTTTSLGYLRSPFDFAFLSQIVRYVTVYGSFLLLDFIIAPGLIRKERIVLNILLLISLFLIAGLVFG